MEQQLKKLKFQDESDADIPAENEDSDPQQRNLIKSKLNSQAKTVHKDLIRKSSGRSRLPVVKHTQEGMYVGIPTDTTEGSDDDTDFDSDNQCPSVIDLREKLEGNSRSGSPYSSFGRNVNKVQNVRSSDLELADKTTSADVHKTIPGKGEKGVWETPKRASNIYVKPAELK